VAAFEDESCGVIVGLSIHTTTGETEFREVEERSHSRRAVLSSLAPLFLAAIVFLVR
jgi:hypothetical protein